VRKSVSPTVAVLAIVVVVVIAVLVWRKFLSPPQMNATAMSQARRKHMDQMQKSGRMKNPQGRRGGGQGQGQQGMP
jgi:hypothetical protein